MQEQLEGLEVQEQVQLSSEGVEEDSRERGRFGGLVTMDMRELKDLGVSSLPWKLIKGIFVWLEGNGGDAVAEIYSSGSDEEELARGHLFKAAPYLYDALYKMVGTCRTCKSRDCKNCLNHNAYCMKEALDALEMANWQGNFKDRTAN